MVVDPLQPVPQALAPSLLDDERVERPIVDPRGDCCGLVPDLGRLSDSATQAQMRLWEYGWSFASLNHGVMEYAVEMDGAGGQHESVPCRMKERHVLIECQEERSCRVETPPE